MRNNDVEKDTSSSDNEGIWNGDMPYDNVRNSKVNASEAEDEADADAAVVADDNYDNDNNNVC